MRYFASFQLKGLSNCQMLKFEVRKNGVTLVPIESDLHNKTSLRPNLSDIFSKLKLRLLVALQPFGLQEDTVPHMKYLYFFYNTLS